MQEQVWYTKKQNLHSFRGKYNTKFIIMWKTDPL